MKSEEEQLLIPLKQSLEQSLEQVIGTVIGTLNVTLSGLHSIGCSM